jgi:hypothetical protein
MNCISLHLVGQLLTLLAECLVLLITVVSVRTQQKNWIAVANRLACLCLETHCRFSSAESCYKACSNATSSMKILRLEESALPSARCENFLKCQMLNYWGDLTSDAACNCLYYTWAIAWYAVPEISYLDLVVCSLTSVGWSTLIMHPGQTINFPLSCPIFILRVQCKLRSFLSVLISPNALLDHWLFEPFQKSRSSHTWHNLLFSAVALYCMRNFFNNVLYTLFLWIVFTYL